MYWFIYCKRRHCNCVYSPIFPFQLGTISRGCAVRIPKLLARLAFRFTAFYFTVLFPTSATTEVRRKIIISTEAVKLTLNAAAVPTCFYHTSFCSQPTQTWLETTVLPIVKTTIIVYNRVTESTSHVLNTDSVLFCSLSLISVRPCMSRVPNINYVRYLVFFLGDLTTFMVG